MSLPDDGVQAPDLRRTLEDTERLGQRLRLLGRGQECPETKQIRSKGLTLLVRQHYQRKAILRRQGVFREGRWGTVWKA